MNTYANKNANSQSIATLTLNDSKILGNIKPKLKKLEETYNIQTNKFKTLNSSWTPLYNKNVNRSVNKFSLI